MDQQQAAEVLRNLDLRTRRMEQILPDLPTRQEMREAIDSSIKAAVAPLATREELHDAIQAAVAPLATRDEMHEAIQAAVAPLATRQELREAVAPLATRQELREAIAPLATRQELREAVAPLATRQELREAIAPLATRQELAAINQNLQGTMADWREEARRYAQVLVEDVRDETRFHLEAMGITADQLTRNYDAVRARMEEMVRTAAQQHVSCRKTHEEWRAYFEDKMKTHAKELAEFRKKVEKIRAAAKAGAGRPKRKVS
jgi:hypothetical protein